MAGTTSSSGKRRPAAEPLQAAAEAGAGAGARGLRAAAEAATSAEACRRQRRRAAARAEERPRHAAWTRAGEQGSQEARGHYAGECASTGVRERTSACDARRKQEQRERGQGWLCARGCRTPARPWRLSSRKR
jgi:hypothetical protein